MRKRPTFRRKDMWRIEGAPAVPEALWDEHWEPLLTPADLAERMPDKNPRTIRRDLAAQRWPVLRTRAVITASPCASVSMPNRIPTSTATKPWSSAARTERAAQRASLRKLVRREERQKVRDRWFASDAGVLTFSQNTFPRR